jgi:Ni/Co efflux regulator RcnB
MEEIMKRALLFASALAFLAVPIAIGPAAADVVVKDTKHHGVVVKHTGGGQPNVIMRHNPPGRPGHFYHRGNWFVRVHGPAFHYPHGWSYRTWRVGMVLPALFLASDYYYDDYAPLGLQAPPPGYRWVRYGDDLLLVNLRTGSVEDVVYGVFD